VKLYKCSITINKQLRGEGDVCDRAVVGMTIKVQTLTLKEGKK